MLFSSAMALLLAADPMFLWCNPRPGAEGVASEVCERVSGELARAGLTPASATETRARLTVKEPCRKTECYGPLAVQLGPNAVLVVADVGKIGKLVAVHVEAVKAGETTRLAFGDVSASVGSYDAINTVARQVSESLATLKPAAVVDVPKPPPVFEPAQPAPVAPLVLTQPPVPRGMPLWVPITIGAAALVCAGLAVVFGISTLGQRSALDAKRDVMTMVIQEPGSQVLARVNGINTSATLSLGFGIGAGVLTALAVGLATQVAAPVRQ